NTCGPAAHLRAGRPRSQGPTRALGETPDAVAVNGARGRGALARNPRPPSNRQTRAPRNLPVRLAPREPMHYH
ncbi:MAG: hypothetical protein OXI15_17910, partial [Chromatiales bacterium]|nr:hypothetical protein [Chromatiales bacterium]